MHLPVLVVKFWRIGRDCNQVADGEAKMGAEKEAIEHYRMISGVMV